MLTPVSTRHGMAASSSALFRRLGGVTAVGFVSYFAEYAAFIVVLAWISDKLTITFGTGAAGYLLVGTISGLYLVLSGLVAVPMGHLCDKYGRHLLSVVGCILGASAMLSLLLIGSISSLPLYLAAVAVSLTALGLGHGTYTASTLAYVGDIASDADLGKSYGFIEDVEFAAYAFGPGAGGVIAVILGRELTFATSGLLLLSAATIAYFAMKERSVRSNILADSKVATTLANPLEPPAGLPESAAVSWQDFFAVLNDSTFGITVLTTVVISLAFTSFFLYVSLYAQNLSAVPVIRAVGAASGSVMAAASIVTLVPLGHVEDKTGRRMPFLVTGMIVAAISLSFVFSSPTIFVFLASALTFGVALSMTRVSQYVILSEKSKPENRAAVMGTNHAFEHAGYGLGALVGGVLIAVLGRVETFRYLAAVLLLCSLLFFLVATRKKIK